MNNDLIPTVAKIARTREFIIEEYEKGRLVNKARVLTLLREYMDKVDQLIDDRTTQTKRIFAPDLRLAIRSIRKSIVDLIESTKD